MSSNIPPESLNNLILNLEYLGGISNNQKYCFITKTYVPNTWYYGLWRGIMGESQEINGHSTMERYCRDASQQWEIYKNNEDFSDLLLDAIVKARHGIQRCHDNYQTLQKSQIATSIRISVLGPLDKIIPKSRKDEEGIISGSRTKRIDSFESKREIEEEHV